MADEPLDPVLHRLAEWLLLGEHVPAPPLSWYASTVLPFFPAEEREEVGRRLREATVARSRAGLALVGLRRLIRERRRQRDEVADRDEVRALHAAMRRWAGAGRWLGALATVDRTWLVRAQDEMQQKAPSLVGLVGMFAPSPAALRRMSAITGRPTEFRPAAVDPAVVQQVQRVLGAQTPATSLALGVIQQWIDQLDDPRLARQAHCGIVRVDRAEVSIRSVSFAEAVQEMLTRVPRGMIAPHYLVQACRWQLRDPKVTVHPRAAHPPRTRSVGRPTVIVGGYFAQSFGTTRIVRLPRGSPAAGQGPSRALLPFLYQVDLFARHAVALMPVGGAPAAAITPTPRWLFQDSRADVATVEVHGARTLSAAGTWTAKSLPHAQIPAGLATWTAPTALLKSLTTAGVLLARQAGTPPGQTTTSPKALRSLNCELLLPDAMLGTALFDWDLPNIVPVGRRSRATGAVI